MRTDRRQTARVNVSRRQKKKREEKNPLTLWDFGLQSETIVGTKKKMCSACIHRYDWACFIHRFFFLALARLLRWHEFWSVSQFVTNIYSVGNNNNRNGNVQSKRAGPGDGERERERGCKTACKDGICSNPFTIKFVYRNRSAITFRVVSLLEIFFFLCVCYCCWSAFVVCFDIVYFVARCVPLMCSLVRFIRTKKF